MLVLSRKIGERIVVPQYKLAVTVVAVNDNMVRLGISAPADVAVYREELWVRLGKPATAQPTCGNGTAIGEGGLNDNNRTIDSHAVLERRVQNEEKRQDEAGIARLHVD